MWVPYLLLEPWKAECSRDLVHESFDDKEERDFLIGFFLKNPVTNEWDVDLQLSDSRSEIQLEQLDAKQQKIILGFYRGDAGRLSEIVCKTRDSNPKAALKRCYNHISRLLNLWAVSLGRGFGIAGFRVADPKHGTKWRSVPFRPSALTFSMPDYQGLGEEHCALAWLYREGRNTQSPAYRLLCASNILEAWSKRLGVFGRTDSIIAEKKLHQMERPVRSVTKEMVVFAGTVDRQPEFEGVSFDRLLLLLAPWRERAAGALLAPGTTTGLDDYETNVMMTSVANLADFAARQVLLDEFELCRGIDELDDPATARADAGPGKEAIEGCKSTPAHNDSFGDMA